MLLDADDVPLSSDYVPRAHKHPRGLTCCANKPSPPVSTCCRKTASAAAVRGVTTRGVEPLPTEDIVQSRSRET